MTEEDIEEWTTRVLDAIKNENYKELQRHAELTASGFRASALAGYEKSLYAQCIKRREAEREYENETNWTGNLSTLIYRLFKAS